MSTMSFFMRNRRKPSSRLCRSAVWTGTTARTAKAPLKKVLSLIPEGATVTWGGSESITECGLLDALKNAPVELWDRAEIPQEERKAFYRKAFSADFI